MDNSSNDCRMREEVPAGNLKTHRLPETDVQAARFEINSPRALSLSLGFSSFSKPAGKWFSVDSPDKNQVPGPYTTSGNAEHGPLWTSTVDGEEVYIEGSVPQERATQMQSV